jgi:hypothetical protein
MKTLLAAAAALLAFVAVVALAILWAIRWVLGGLRDKP